MAVREAVAANESGIGLCEAARVVRPWTCDEDAKGAAEARE